jgi:hypothetical protein
VKPEDIKELLVGNILERRTPPNRRAPDRDRGGASSAAQWESQCPCSYGKAPPDFIVFRNHEPVCVEPWRLQAVSSKLHKSRMRRLGKQHTLPWHDSRR